MFIQFIGLCLVAAAWAVFFWRYEIAWHVGIWRGQAKRARKTAKRGRDLYRRMAGDGSVSKPWGAA